MKNFARFKSEEELKEYLTSKEIYYGYPVFGVVVEKSVEMPVPTPTTPTPVPTSVGDYGVVEKAAERYSETNVQVKGIDEPDIVKTDGKNIYYSIGLARIHMPRIMPEYYGKILSILAFPPDNMSVSFEIPKDGNLLLHKDKLVVLSYNEISGYDRENGKNVWRIDVDGNIVTARLYEDRIFVITRNHLDYYDPFPIKPVRVNGKALEIKYTDIYFPRGISSEVLYTVMKVNPDEIYFKFLQENRDLLPEDVLTRIERVMGYDISNRAKFIEIKEYNK